MKKITLFIAALMAVISSTAQDQRSLNGKSKIQRQVVAQKMLKNSAILRNVLANVTSLFAEDFGNGIPSNWQIIDNVSAGLLWKYGFGPNGNSAQAGDSLMSTTAYNGFALVDDDSAGQALPPRNTDLITPPIDCSTNIGVHLAFQEYFSQFYLAMGTISISADAGMTWQDIYVVDATTANPQNIDIDISTWAAGVSDVRIKFNYQGEWDYWWQIDDIIVYQPLTVDGSMLAVESAPTSCQTTSSEMVMISIKNIGINPISNFPASFKVDAGAVITETVSATLNAGDTANFMFAGTADLSALGTHNIIAWISVPSDGSAANDSGVYSMEKLSPIAIGGVNPMTMGFEPSDDFNGWTINDANGDGEYWALAYDPDFTPIVSHSGDYCLRVSYLNADIDDWLFSRCIDLQAGTNYVIDYWVHLANNVGSVDVFSGVNNNITSMSQLISSTSGVAFVWTNTNATFTVPASGTYYIGFHGYEPTNAGNLRLDDINISVAVGVAETNSNAKWFDVYPNPTTETLNIKINRPYDNASIEVVNAHGAVVKSFKAAESTRSIDVSNLKSGLYTINVNFDGQSVYKRFTISK